MTAAPLVDRFGRVHTNLRVSVTDRCNIRCFYCMPNEEVQFLPRAAILRFEEIVGFVRALIPAGVRKVRLTGGEPLVRSDLPTLVAQLHDLDGLEDLALTTNGILLADQAERLRTAGLKRINISLDSLQEEVFQKISRRSGLHKVLEGIAAAQEAGFERIRLNAVAIRDLTEEDIVPLVRFAAERGMEMRFIEFMPLDAEGRWDESKVLSGDEIRRIITEEIGPLAPLSRGDPSQPAIDYRLLGGGVVGFINPVTHPFCGDCNRLRLTAEGQVRNCLFSTEEWDARSLLRAGSTDAEIVALVRNCLAAKKAGHGVDGDGFAPSARAMYQIGG